MGQRPTQEAIQAMQQDVVGNIQAVRAAVQAAEGIEGLEHLGPAMAGIETFVSIALRLMAKTNPSKIIDVMRTVEIKARLDGLEIVDDA